MSDPRVPVLPSTNSSSNGEMLNRVQQLRLGNQLGGSKGGGGGASWLPWVLCLLLAGTWALVGVRGYRAAPADGTAAAGDPAAANLSGTNAASTAAGGPVAGSVQLVVKGYIMPAQQIAVSPIDVGGRLIEQNV